MDKQELFGHLEDTLVMIDAQIDEVETQARNWSGGPIEPRQIRDTNGGYLLTPLLVSRAHVLAGMALLEEVLGDGEEEWDTNESKALFEVPVLGDGEEELDDGEKLDELNQQMGLKLPPEPKQDRKIWMHIVTGDCIYSEEPDNVMVARNFIRPKGQWLDEDMYPHLAALYGPSTPRPFASNPRKFKLPVEADLKILTGKDD